MAKSRFIKERFRSRKQAETYADDNGLDIVARRNSKGYHSSHGWSWTFEPSDEEDEGIGMFPNREWAITIDYRKGKRPFHADLFIIAPADATPTMLADQSRGQLKAGDSFLANWLEGGFAEITSGDLTNERPATFVRRFERKK